MFKIHNNINSTTFEVLCRHVSETFLDLLCCLFSQRIETLQCFHPFHSHLYTQLLSQHVHTLAHEHLCT